jgi:hypothetical protein
MEAHDEYLKSRLALSALRQALGYMHRSDPSFDRMYGGAIAQLPQDEDEPAAGLLHRFRELLERIDDKVGEIVARAPREEEASLAAPVVRHDLSEKQAEDLEALDLAMHIFHPGRSFESGYYDKGLLIECAMERPDLLEAFLDILMEAERFIRYERRPSSDSAHQAARLAMPFIERRAPPEAPERTAEEEVEALDEWLAERNGRDRR